MFSAKTSSPLFTTQQENQIVSPIVTVSGMLMPVLITSSRSNRDGAVSLFHSGYIRCVRARSVFSNGGTGNYREESGALGFVSSKAQQPPEKYAYCKDY